MDTMSITSLAGVEIINADQGSEGWLAARAKSDGTASEASAMMGVSKHTSRTALLDQKRGRVVAPLTQKQKELFEEGHRKEESLRIAIELDKMITLFPLTLVREVEGLSLLASLDGITPNGKTIWEHKSWNKTLAENVSNGVLEEHYTYQLEQQLLVSGAEEALFSVSDGTMKNHVSMIYVSNPDLRAKLIAGWKQFHADLAGHELAPKKEVATGVAVKLPAITWSLAGSVVTTNLSDIVPVIQELADAENMKALVTDQDFADKDALNKAVKQARENLKREVQAVTEKFTSYASFRTVAADLDKILQQMQSNGEKAVAAQKELRKNTIKAAAAQDLNEFLKECNSRIFPVDILSITGAGQFRPDFDGAIKGLKSLTSIEHAVHAELTRVKVELTLIADRAANNITYLNSVTNKLFLFTDLPQLVGMDIEPFSSVVKSRLEAHRAAEEEKEQAIRDKVLREERERVEREEAARIQKEAEESRKLVLSPELRQQVVDSITSSTETTSVQDDFPDIPLATESNMLKELKAWQAKWNVSDLAVVELSAIIHKYI